MMVLCISMEESLDNRYMEQAIEAARAALVNGVLPVGAVVVLSGQLVSVGCRDKSDFHFGHAEMIALRKALTGRRIKRSEGLTVYSTLEPCVMCLGTILHCPVIRVVYGLEDPWGGATGMMNCLNSRRHYGKIPMLTTGVHRKASMELLRKYFQNTTEVIWRNEENPLVQLVLSSSGSDVNYRAAA